MNQKRLAIGLAITITTLILIVAIAFAATNYLSNQASTNAPTSSANNTPNPLPNSTPTIEYVVLKEGKLIKHLSDGKDQPITEIKGSVIDFDFNPNSNIIAYTTGRKYGIWKNSVPTDLYLYKINEGSNTQLVAFKNDEKTRCGANISIDCANYSLVVQPVNSPDGAYLTFYTKNKLTVYNIASDQFIDKLKGIDKLSLPEKISWSKDSKLLKLQYLNEFSYYYWINISNNELVAWGYPISFKNNKNISTTYRSPSEDGSISSTYITSQTFRNSNENYGLLFMGGSSTGLNANFQVATPGMLYSVSTISNKVELIRDNENGDLRIIPTSASTFYEYNPTNGELNKFSVDHSSMKLTEVSSSSPSMIKSNSLVIANDLSEYDFLTILTGDKSALINASKPGESYDLAGGNMKYIKNRYILLNSNVSALRDDHTTYTPSETLFVIDRQTGEVKKIG